MIDNDMLTVSAMKREYGLTDKLIKAMGEPDDTKPNPRYKSAAPMKLYDRARVEQWIQDNMQAYEASQQRRKSAQKAVETKKADALAIVREMLAGFEMRKVSRKKLYNRTLEFIAANYHRDYDYGVGVTAKALCSYARHNYTNYETILARIQGMVGAGELYAKIKLYLCCLIVREYELDEHPAIAAYGQGAGDWTDLTPEETEARIKIELGI